MLAAFSCQAMLLAVTGCGPQTTAKPVPPLGASHNAPSHPGTKPDKKPQAAEDSSSSGAASDATSDAASASPKTRGDASYVFDPDFSTDAGGEPPEPVADIQQPAKPMAERFVMFTPGGPLVVVLWLTIDQQPHYLALENLVQRVLKAADTDGDGTPTWSEVVASNSFKYGQFGNLPIENPAAQQQIKRQYDINSNGILEANEAPRFLTRNAGQSKPFWLTSTNRHRAYNRIDSPLRVLLDSNDDGILTADETTGALARLLSRDSNDDEMITAAELDPQSAAALQGSMRGGVMSMRGGRGPRTGLILGERANWSSIQYAIEELYGYGNPVKKDGFRLVPALFKTLDSNGNGRLDSSEYKALDTVQPQLQINVAFGKGATPGMQGGEVSLREISPELKKVMQPVSNTRNRLRFRLPGVDLLFYANDQAPPAGDAQQGQNLLTRYDVNKNGYLEKEESPPTAVLLNATFETVDADGDGKVYPQEMVAFFSDRQAVFRSQIRAMAADRPDAMFAAIDLDGDERLDAREISAIDQRLASFDFNGDKQLDIEEIPGSITVGFVRGNPAQGDALFATPMISTAYQIETAPGWFIRMDVNGDGEISRREFPGRQSQFNTLDTNGDGFITTAESTAVSK